MAIRNDEELAAAVALVGEKLQEVQDYLGQDSAGRGKIRFPRGYIRPADHFRSRLRFILDRDARDNLAYALMLGDVYRWLTNRTDLFGTAREMIIKSGIVLAGSICETIAVEYTRGKIGNRNKFKVRCGRMCDDDIISDALRKELEWLWDARTSIHIFEVEGREYDRYVMSDYNRAILALRALRDELDAHSDANAAF